jgi:hypothetical protein
VQRLLEPDAGVGAAKTLQSQQQLYGASDGASQ